MTHPPAQVGSPFSGKCLNVDGAEGGDVADYTNVDLLTCSGGDEQARPCASVPFACPPPLRPRPVGDATITVVGGASVKMRAW